MKKTLTLVFAAALLLAVLASCVSSVTETTAAETTAAETTAAETTAAETAAAETTAAETTAAETTAAAAKDLNLEELYTAIVAAVSEGQEELVMLPESDPEVIGSFYEGLSDLTLTQQVFYLPPVTGWASEIMLVEAADEKTADAAATIFQARIDLGKDVTGYPETAAAWASNAQVQQSGNYVALIALPEGYTIPEDVFSLSPGSAG